MTTNPSNPAGPAGSRQPVSEDALVDWIDGSLSPQDVRRLAAESGRADLHDRIGQMQRHRAALRSLGDTSGAVRAPADLHNRVLAALERESLVGHETDEILKLERSAPTAAVPAQLRLVREETDDRAAWTRRVPSLALAAGLLLLVAGAAYWTTQMMRSASPRLATPGTTVAKNDANVPAGMPAAAGSQVEQATPATTLAANEQADTMTAMSAADASMARSSAFAAGPVAREVNIDEALSLAREGRLAIRVVSRDLKGLGKLEQDGTQPREGQSWELSREVPPAVLAASLPATSEASRAFVRASQQYGSSAQPAMARGSAMFSTASLISPLIGPGAAVTSIAPASVVNGPSLSASYLLDLPQTERAFDVIRAVLRDRLKGEVVFAELPDTVPVTMTADAQDALWWTKPSSQWSSRVSVPLLIER